MAVVREEQGDLLHRLMEELQSLRSFPTRTGVFGNHYIVRLGVKPFRTLCQVQDKIGADGELRFIELLQAAVYRVCITVNEKDAEGGASVGRRALRAHTPLIRLGLALRQV